VYYIISHFEVFHKNLNQDKQDGHLLFIYYFWTNVLFFIYGVICSFRFRTQELDKIHLSGTLAFRYIQMQVTIYLYH
jgi:hypothetical protein